MDLQEVVKALPEDQREVVLSAIEAEKQRGIDESRRKGSEAAGLRKQLEAHRSAIKNTFDIEVPDVAELPEVLSKFKTQTVNKSDYVPVSEFKLLKKQFEDANAKTEAAERNLRISRTAEKLNHAFGDTFYAKDLLIKDQIESGKVRLTESGDVVFIDGDEEIDVTKGIEQLKKKRPDMVKNNSKPGGGSTAGSKDKKDGKISYDEFSKLDPIAQRDYMREKKGFSET